MTYIQKHRICYRISKLNKNNLQLFRFFNKLTVVVYMVASCDCFIQSRRQKKFRVAMENQTLKDR